MITVKITEEEASLRLVSNEVMALHQIVGEYCKQVFRPEVLERVGVHPDDALSLKQELAAVLDRFRQLNQ